MEDLPFQKAGFSKRLNAAFDDPPADAFEIERTWCIGRIVQKRSDMPLSVEKMLKREFPRLRLVSMTDDKYTALYLHDYRPLLSKMEEMFKYRNLRNEIPVEPLEMTELEDTFLRLEELLRKEETGYSFLIDAIIPATCETPKEEEFVPFFRPLVDLLDVRYNRENPLASSHQVTRIMRTILNRINTKGGALDDKKLSVGPENLSALYMPPDLKTEDIMVLLSDLGTYSTLLLIEMSEARIGTNTYERAEKKLRKKPIRKYLDQYTSDE